MVVGCLKNVVVSELFKCKKHPYYWILSILRPY